MPTEMKSLAIILRASQLYAHQAHNLATGCTFFQDHKAFAKFYEAYESAYDSVVERMIGLTGDCDITSITRGACDIVEKSKFKDSRGAFAVLLATEKSICNVCITENKKASLGTQNLLQGIADGSEMRQYQIQQRLKDN
jgi:DNA-binding ferritin-like protein